MEIAEVHQITGVGTVVIGEVACDEIDHKDEVRIIGESFAQGAIVGGVERHGKSGPAKRGEQVGMLLVGRHLREQLPVVAGMKVYLAARNGP